MKVKKSRGFTIIETMISVALFLIVVMAGMESLLNASNIHEKSQSQRSIMDNLSFIIEDMSRNIRTGYDYRCYDINESFSFEGIPETEEEMAQDCLDGGWALVFEESNGNVKNNNDQWVYMFDSNGDLLKATDGGSDVDSFNSLNPSEIKFKTGSGFTVIGARKNDVQQPFVVIRLIGEITSPKNGTITPFSIQTSVSQRLIDIEQE